MVITDNRKYNNITVCHRKMLHSWISFIVICNEMMHSKKENVKINLVNNITARN